VKTLNIYICPDDSNQKLNPTWEGIGISYAADGFIGPYSHALGVININQPWWLTDVSRSDSQVTQPAATIVLAEKHNDDVQNFCGADPGCGNISRGGGYGNVFDGVNWWDTYAPGEIPNGTLVPAAWPYGPNGAVSAKHANQANFNFCDGHAKSMNPAATDPDPNNQPQNNMWDSERTSTSY
jgi:prepilin-type processing-associated H-X9-DG protein